MYFAVDVLPVDIAGSYYKPGRAAQALLAKP